MVRLKIPLAVLAFLASVALCGFLRMPLHAAARGDSGNERGKLSFELPDTYGRIVKSSDYLGAPVLVDFGSCWCGGCQEDAPKIRYLAEKYGPRGLHVLRSTAGDNELATADFQRHYKLTFPSLLDTNRLFEKQYNTNGWPFVVLADASGNILYSANSPISWENVERLIAQQTSQGRTMPSARLDGVTYSHKTLERSGESERARLCERFPSIACGPSGEVFLAFTGNASGSDDVFARFYDGRKWSDDVPLAASGAEEYASRVAVGASGDPCFVWVSNAEGNYSVYAARSTPALEIARSERVTTDRHDTMGPCIGAGNDGVLWLTYYRWVPWQGLDRDREVFARKHDGRSWSPEVQISPTDVPRYEDHFDPTVAAYGDGALVMWSWDYHENSGYTDQAREPTVFCRVLSGQAQPGAITVVSAKQIDTMPAVAASGDGAACAWESIYYQKGIRGTCKGVLTRVERGSVSSTGRLASAMANVCTPRLAWSPEGVLTAVWAQYDGRAWTLMRADFDSAARGWGKPAALVSSGNPRWPAMDYASDGTLWVAFSAEADREKGRHVVVLNFPKQAQKLQAGVAGQAQTNR